MTDVELGFLKEIADAMKIMAGAMASISGTMAMTYQQTFPIKNPPRDIDLHRPPTEEEILKRNQGASSERLEDWMRIDEQPDEVEKADIGPRERAWLEEERARKEAAAAGEAGPGGTRRRPEGA
jgi:hypothetical protein